MPYYVERVDQRFLQQADRKPLNGCHDLRQAAIVKEPSRDDDASGASGFQEFRPDQLLRGRAHKNWLKLTPIQATDQVCSRNDGAAEIDGLIDYEDSDRRSGLHGSASRFH